MRISDGSSDVCSSDLLAETLSKFQAVERIVVTTAAGEEVAVVEHPESERSALEDAGLGVATSLRERALVLLIPEGNRLVGEISVEFSPRFVQTRMRDAFLYVLVFALVGPLVALALHLAVPLSPVGN